MAWTFMRVFKIKKCIHYAFMNSPVIKRHLCSPSVLGLLKQYREREECIQMVGSHRDDFVSTLRKQLEKNDQVFTEDLKTILLLADTKEEMCLALSASKKYTNYQREQILQRFFPDGVYVLGMFHRHKETEIQNALNWFTDEGTTVRCMKQNMPSYRIMMDMLFDAGYYTEVVALLPDYITDFKKMEPVIVTLVLASLYKLNTDEALVEAQNVLQHCCVQNVMLNKRCAFLSCMLAQQQNNPGLMLEIMQLPIFSIVSTREFSGFINLKIMAYSSLGRLQEAMWLIENVLSKFENGQHVFFEESLVSLEDTLKASDEQDLCQDFLHYKRSLYNAGFMFDGSIYDFILSVIREKEHTSIKTLV